MKKLLLIVLALMLTSTATGLAESDAAPAYEPLQLNSRGEAVQRLQTKLMELDLLRGGADGILGPRTEEALKAAQRLMGREETGVVDSEDDLYALLALREGDGVNLALGTGDEWSEWMSPSIDTNNQCFTVAYAYPGELQRGDAFTCQLEIEFSGVKASGSADEGKPFAFYTQGRADGGFDIPNIWDAALAKLTEAPEDGVYRYAVTRYIVEKNAAVTRFDLGFRCDYWAAGQFRVRRIKVERGYSPTEWSVSPKDIGLGINLARNTSSEWSDWMAPEPGKDNQCFTVSSALLKDKQIGNAYTCQLEIEFEGVGADEGNQEAHPFLFMTQGAVDGSWKIPNVWSSSLVRLSAPPKDGVYNYVHTSYITINNVGGIHFDLGFRCDYWTGGRFRVRSVKVEKGTTATLWRP